MSTLYSQSDVKQMLRERTEPRRPLRLRLRSWLQQAKAFLTGSLFFSGLMATVALGVWLLALPLIDMRAMNDLGLISILPPLSYAGLVLLTLGFVYSLRRTVPAILYAYVLILIFMLYGVLPLISEAPRFMTAWTHAGFIELITRTGESATWMDARFSWPGFFSGSGIFTLMGGYENAYQYMDWGSLVFNLVYFPPLLLIFRALSNNERHVWLAVWFFYINNWVGQDYFAPQAMAFLWYLVIMAMVLVFFKKHTDPNISFADRWFLFGRPLQSLIERVCSVRVAGFIQNLLSPVDTPNRATTPLQRAGLVVMATAILTALSMSHQLTPFFLLAGLGGLWIADRQRLTSLTPMVLLITVTWIVYMTTAFLASNLVWMLEEIGRAGSSLDANFTERILKGSAQHEIVVRMRSIMSVTIWGLAGLGALWQLYKGKWHLNALILMAMPLGIIAMQSYGGEVLIRVYFFMLPFAAFLAAGLYVSPQGKGFGGARIVLVSGVCLLLLAGFLVARFGNERIDYVTQQEFAATQWLYEQAEYESHIVMYSSNAPVGFREIEHYNHHIEPDLFYPTDVSALSDFMQSRGGDAYLLLSRTQAAYGELFIGLSPGWMTALEDELLASADYRSIFVNDDARIFQFVGSGSTE